MRSLLLSFIILSSVGSALAQNYQPVPLEARNTRGCSARNPSWLGVKSGDTVPMPSRSIKQREVCGGYHWTTQRADLVYERLMIASRPRHGRLTVRHPGQYYYTAPSNYVGTDRFTLRLCGKQNGIPGCLNLAYVMTIER